MNKANLYRKFDEALTWNGFLFVLRKISKTFLSFVLLYKLSTSDFSIWANIYSIIYITLLWLDFGFSRSLPLYCLSFAKNTKIKNKFIASVILFKVAISVLGALILFLLIPYLTKILSLPPRSTYYFLGCLLFLSEGIKSILRLIFYSYFWQKRFNLLESVIITLNTIFIIFMAGQAGTGNSILKYVFIADIAGAFTLVVLSCFMLRDLSKDVDYQGEKTINTKQLVNDFLVHSGVIWSLLSVNSLTDRNFLVPFLTYLFGPYLANIFKVANDGALLFQRFIIKTIGTTGTSLFAHIETGQVTTTAKQHTTEINNAFLIFNKRLIALSFPLVGIITLIFLQLDYDTLLLKTFFLLVSLYLIQIIFMAYERILEVKRNYKELFISFIPYILAILPLIAIIANGKYKALFTLPLILTLIHSFRILSLLIRIFYAKKLYNVKFPVKLAVTFGCLTIAISFLTHLLFKYLGGVAKFHGFLNP